MQHERKKLSSIFPILLSLKVLFPVLVIILSSDCLGMECMEYPYSSSHHLGGKKEHFRTIQTPSKDQASLHKAIGLTLDLCDKYNDQLKAGSQNSINRNNPDFLTNHKPLQQEEKRAPISSLKPETSLPLSSMRQASHSPLIVTTMPSIDNNPKMLSTVYKEKVISSSQSKRRPQEFLSHSQRAASPLIGKDTDNNGMFGANLHQAVNGHDHLNNAFNPITKKVDHGQLNHTVSATAKSVAQNTIQIDNDFSRERNRRNNRPEFSTRGAYARERTIKLRSSHNVPNKTRKNNRQLGETAKASQTTADHMSFFSSKQLTDPILPSHKEQPLVCGQGTQSALLDRLQSRSSYKGQLLMSTQSTQSSLLDRLQSRSSYKGQLLTSTQSTQSSLLDRLQSRSSCKEQPSQPQFNRSNNHKEANVRERASTESGNSPSFFEEPKGSNRKFVGEDGESRRIFELAPAFQQKEDPGYRARSSSASRTQPASLQSNREKNHYNNLSSHQMTDGAPVVGRHAQQYRTDVKRSKEVNFYHNNVYRNDITLDVRGDMKREIPHENISHTVGTSLRRGRYLAFKRSTQDAGNQANISTKNEEDGKGGSCHNNTHGNSKVTSGGGGGDDNENVNSGRIGGCNGNTTSNTLVISTKDIADSGGGGGDDNENVNSGGIGGCNGNTTSNTLVISTKDIANIGNNNRIYFNFRKRFINQQVQGLDGILDHQGHIIPQNLIADMIRLDLQKVQEDHQQTLPISNYREWLVAYGPSLQMNNFIRFNVDTWLEGDDNTTLDSWTPILSRVIWNPANICRAPEDNQRGGTPGDKIDEQVLERVMLLNAQQGGLLKVAKVAINEKDPEKFFQAWAALQDNYENNNDNGFYSFEWCLDNEGRAKPKEPDLPQ